MGNAGQQWMSNICYGWIRDHIQSISAAPLPVPWHIPAACRSVPIHVITSWVTRGISMFKIRDLEAPQGVIHDKEENFSWKLGIWRYFLQIRGILKKIPLLNWGISLLPQGRSHVCMPLSYDKLTAGQRALIQSRHYMPLHADLLYIYIFERRQAKRDLTAHK
jgi:hypothetical protein